MITRRAALAALGTGTDYPVLMAAALLSTLPVLLLFAVAQRAFVTGLARTGLR